MSSVRVRIAPSPSGFLHIGTAKIALMNWLYARQQGGVMVLRLEDTDAERTDEAFVQAMCEGFHWLGIDWDEGPPFGDVPEKGALGPYRQSQRKDAHTAAAHRLLESGRAYKCFCTKDELDAMREEARINKRPPRYTGRCRHLSSEDIAARGDAPFAVRFKVEPGTTAIDDLVQGRVEIENTEFDDFVILKPNGAPIFHLAVVVDDAEMRISHVLRGDDHLTNAFRHAMLFEALGYAVPIYGHLPMVLDETGKKYSKRHHGANVLDWRDDGYLPETMLNYVALMGWNPGNERELFTLDELLQAFSIQRLGKSPAKFDLKRLQWLNGQHMRMLSVEELTRRALPLLDDAGLDYSSKSEEWLARMVGICQEKLRTLNEIVTYTDFFFVEPSGYEEKAVKKQWQKDGADDTLALVESLIRGAEPWSHETLHDAFEAEAGRSGLGLGALVHPARLALTGKSIGPGLFELAELLGRETCLERIARARKYVRGLDAA